MSATWKRLAHKNRRSARPEPLSPIALAVAMSNMVGGRPRAARSATAVPEGRPMAQLGYQGARHLVPERLPSASKEKPVTLRVIDLNIDTLRHVNSLSETLKRLDFSCMDLKKIPAELVERLFSLEKLDLNDNLLTDDSFPESFVNLESLVDLSLHANSLTRLPAVFGRLQRLSRLKLGHNQVSSLKGIERLKRLQVLVMDHNCVDTLPKEFFANLKRLEIFNCSFNKLSSISSDVRNLRHLRDLDVSSNNLTYLPPEVFLLPRVEVLNASSNQISRLPTINVKGRLKKKLTCIDLSDNALMRFPGHLMFMTNRLDLSRNKIRVIPLSLVDKLDQVWDMSLLLHDNPMTNPPLEVCECGLRSIITYFMEIKADIKVYQGLKVVMLGASGQGKTSLVQSLLDQQPRLTDEERSTGVDIYDYSVDLEEGNPVGKSLNLSLWDLAGHPRYRYPHYFFLHQPSLVLVVVNLAEYRSDNFYDLIGYWLDWIVARTNQLVILPVGTHADQLTKERNKEVCDEITTRIYGFIKDHVDSIEVEIKKITTKKQIFPALTEQLKQYLHLQKLQTIVYENGVVPVSSKDLSGFDSLLKAVEQMASNKEVFPNVMKVIPTLWVEVENYVDDRAYAMQIPLMTWDAYVDEITKRFGMKHLISQITAYLHDTGKVLWYSDHPTLKNFVFLRPSWLTDVLKQVFRHDVADMDYAVEEAFKNYGVSTTKFERMRREIADDGTLDREFLKCCWAQIFNTELNRPVVEVIAMLLDHFHIGYPVNNRASFRKGSAVSGISRVSTSVHSTSERVDSAGTKRSEQDGTKIKVTVPGASAEGTVGGIPKITKIVLPWLRETPQPRGFVEEYTSYAHVPCVCAVFRFPRFFPPGVFSMATTRMQSDTFGLKVLYHWAAGMYARHEAEHARVLLQRIDHQDDGSTCVRLELRPEDKVQDKDIEMMWKVLLPVIKDVESILVKFTGVRLERYMECPLCHDMAFLGEWQTPKELQTVTSRQCDTCRAAVSTVYLIQPKERRLVEEFLLHKMKRDAERRSAESRQSAGRESRPQSIAESRESLVSPDKEVT